MKALIDAIPEFGWEYTVFEPWRFGIWIVVTGFLVSTACGIVGNYLILRRMALVGDAISHSVLPGIIVAVLITKTLTGPWIFIGATLSALLTTVIIEFIHRKSRIKQDAAIGTTFTVMFAIGVILVSQFASGIHVDAECVLYGDLGEAGFAPKASLFGVEIAPPLVIQMAVITLIVIALVGAFYKELLLTSFDPGLATSLGVNAKWFHYGLMTVLAATVVASFEAVGSILVLAVLILPGATALLLTTRLVSVLWLIVLHSFLSAVIGFQIGFLLNCNQGAALALAGFLLFILAWIFSPSQGLLARAFRRVEMDEEPELIGSAD